MRPLTNLGTIGGTNGLTANADITIQHNTINNIIGARGISFTADGNSTTKLLIDDNHIDRLGSTSKHGISVNLTDVTVGNVPTAQVTITNNLIGTAANLWTAGAGTGNGILLQTQNASQMTALLSGNVVTANTSSVIEVMRVRAINTSTLNATVTNNTLTDNDGSHVEFDATAGSGTVAGTVNLNISGNTLPGGGVGVIKLSEGSFAGSDINVTQASSAAVSTANSNATVTVTGAPDFGQVAPPTPTLPTLP
jgi:hypothetical protein